MIFFDTPVRVFFCLAGATLLSAGLVRAMIGLAVLDHPDHRSAHNHPTPKGGGIGIMLAFATVWPLLLLFAPQPMPRTSLLAVVALGILCGVSWLDDLRQWPAGIKLAAQCGAAVLVVAGTGTANTLPGMGLAVLWLIFCTNAINFMDGLNGLVSGCLLVGCLLLAGAAPSLGVPELRWPAALLAACLAGFLPFNFPQARIFMGDVGSQGCGLLAGMATLYGAQHATTPSGWLFGPAVLAPLLYDVTLTLIRRSLAHQRLMQAHRGHLYQVLYRSGLTVRTVSMAEWGLTAWGGSIACATATLPGPEALPLATLLVLVPQLGWTALAVVRAQKNPIGPW